MKFRPSPYQGIKYFDVTEDDGRIVRIPARPDLADAVRTKLADLGITEADVSEAVAKTREGSAQG